jgi:hypothetical protein
VDYSTLIAEKSTPGSIKAWVRYTEIDSETVLEDAQNYIWQRLRIREQRTLLARGTIPTGVDGITLPLDFLDPITFIIRHPWTELHLRNEKALLLEARTFDEDSELIEGLPMHYAIVNTAEVPTTIEFDAGDKQMAIFDYKADDDYFYDLMYYRKPSLLGPLNTVNILTNRYTPILRHTCIGFAAMSMKDNDEASTSLRMADAMMDNAKEMDDLSRRGQEA